MDAPEKIFLSRNALGIFCNSWWLEPDKSLDNVEYIRKNAFIEKAAKWINEHTSLSEKLVIENFVNYMKGE